MVTIAILDLRIEGVSGSESESGVAAEVCSAGGLPSWRAFACGVDGELELL
jgi:hypothetical protein